MSFCKAPTKPVEEIDGSPIVFTWNKGLKTIADTADGRSFVLYEERDVNYQEWLEL